MSDKEEKIIVVRVVVSVMCIDMLYSSVKIEIIKFDLFVLINFKISLMVSIVKIIEIFIN